MRKHFLAALLLSALTLPLGSVPAQTGGTMTAIVGGMLFDGTGAAPMPATILIEGDRIVAVGKDVAVPRGAKVINARGKAVLPGFIDVHVHWTPGGFPATTPQIATAYVQSGVTTVTDFHQQPEAYAPRRAWLKTLATPHVAFAARLSTPGGHGADWGDANTTIRVSTAEGGAAAIKSLDAYQPDLIKAFADGWRYGSSPDNTSMDQWTLRAISDEAHKRNWPVVTHTVTVERGLVAAHGGVDSLAHGMQDRPITAEEVAAIKATGMAMAPTLAVYDPYKPRDTPVTTDDPRYKRSLVNFGYALGNVKALHDAGVMIAVGTDAGMPGTPHGRSTLHEMELLVKAGMTPSEALVAGTRNSAKVLRIDGDRGTIAVGKRADIVLIDGTPWTTITDLYKTAQVLIDGKLMSGPGAPPLPVGNAAKYLPSVTVPALIDDFERPDKRSTLDTVRLENPDGGLDRTVEITQIVPRDEGGKMLSLSAKMSIKNNAYAGVIVPLTRGSVTPVKIAMYKGVTFDIKGAGDFIVRINGLEGAWEARVSGTDGWTTAQLPFTAFTPITGRGATGAAFTPDGITQVEIGGTRPAGQYLWLSIDNIRFY